jgi:hypothetical protein
MAFLKRPAHPVFGVGARLGAVNTHIPCAPRFRICALWKHVFWSKSSESHTIYPFSSFFIYHLLLRRLNVKNHVIFHLNFFCYNWT